MPLSVRVGGGDLPLPAVLGALLARWRGSASSSPTAARATSASRWLVGGLVLYVVYRTTQGKPLLRRVVVPEKALRGERHEAEYGSILVPIFGDAARRRHRPDRRAPGRRRGRRRLRGGPRGDDRGAVGLRGADVAADRRARCPTPSSSARARRWRAPRRWGRSTRASRWPRRRCARGAPGQAIVDEARRRGVQAIVLAAEEPSKIRGGALLGGRGGPLDNFVGEVTKYVITKAPCQVILTAPPAGERRAPGRPRTATARTPPRRTPARLTPPRSDDARVRAHVVHPDRRRRPRRLVGGARDARRRPRRLRARRGPALARAARLRDGHDVGGRRRALHGRPRPRDRRAARGGHRGGRRVHRLDRRRQHEPDDRPDRRQALRGRRASSCASWTRRAPSGTPSRACTRSARRATRSRCSSARSRRSDAHVRRHRRGRQGRLEPRPRADEQAPRGHA